MSGLDAMCVVVPARDEELLIGRCLTGLARARRVLAAVRPETEVHVMVVLDRCSDGTADIVAAAPGVDALEVAALSVGAARAAGVQHAAGRVAHHDAERVWVACTDADSVVPPSWLLGLARAAEQGYAARVGAVRPDSADEGPELLRRWLARHELGPGHEHVFGANLGVGLAAYEQVGGFPPLASGEDVELVRRLRGAGLPILTVGEDPVLTSARRIGRARGGFAAYLSGLEDEHAEGS
ncbi:glycosyltransferase [Luteipulveratus flavus]|uniref:4,4'-diaponeurosporenoate glycosyltransferase n=1 Tax=Luteipulveratus flavus TaxID=3031728 RepID=A0ABT6C6B8_9MICO|nr:glycosyltransferase [Luteipulveratus sp. YIM 133296]MDF8263619.1 glycosyltransferase [Luteipulveratus sp. YIM 133296]